LCRQLGREAVGLDLPEFDLTDRDRVAAILAEIRPGAVINTAAFTQVDKAEEEVELCRAVNARGVGYVAEACRALDSVLVEISTDYVFGGDAARQVPCRETDEPRPQGVYARTKLEGEREAARWRKHFVVRTCGLYGRSGAKSKGGNFVDGRVADAQAGKRIEMASEQVLVPTSTDDLSRAVLSLIAHARLAPGIYHLVNEGQCSWYEFTRAIVETVGAKTEVVPVDRGGRTGKMRRPLYSVLSNTRARALGIVLRPWREALRAYIESKYLSAQS